MSPTASEAEGGLRERIISPRAGGNSPAASRQRSPVREEQQPVHNFELQQVDLLSVDRVDAVSHTFQAKLFLQLVLRNGGLDPELSEPEAVFPISKETGKPTYRPSAKVRTEHSPKDLTKLTRNLFASRSNSGFGKRSNLQTQST